MYTPSPFAMPNTAHMLRFIDQFSFGMLVSQQLDAANLPFVLNQHEGPLGTLYTHIAKTNPLHRYLSASSKEVLTIFNGPHAYISPTWFAKTPSVPTWNYTTVHAKGIASVMTSEELRVSLKQTVKKYGGDLLDSQEQYRPDSRMTNDNVEQNMKAIVGLKIVLTDIQGQEKLSQNKTTQVQAHIIKQLTLKDPNCKLAKYMSEHLLTS